MVSTRLSRHCGSAHLPLGCPAHTLLPVGPKEPSPIVVLCTGRSSRLASSDVQEFSLQSLVSVRRNKPGEMRMANQDKRSLDDVRRSEREPGTPGTPGTLQAARARDDICDNVNGDEEGVMIAFTIGMRGSLTEHEARAAARAWRKTIAQYPKACVCIGIAGYDSDPRELWRIPEASRHVRRWARFA